MIEYDIDDHVHPPLVGLVNQFAKIGKRAPMWVDTIEIGDVIAVIGAPMIQEYR